jgi:hypothetical protein
MPNPRRHLPPLPVVDRPPLSERSRPEFWPISRSLPDPHELAQTGFPRSGQKHGRRDHGGIPGADVALRLEGVSEAGIAKMK